VLLCALLASAAVVHVAATGARAAPGRGALQRHGLQCLQPHTWPELPPTLHPLRRASPAGEAEAKCSALFSNGAFKHGLRASASAPGRRLAGSAGGIAPASADVLRNSLLAAKLSEWAYPSTFLSDADTTDSYVIPAKFANCES
jgi:hypothetical protein